MDELPVYYPGPMWSQKSSRLLLNMLTYENGAELETMTFTPERDSRSGTGLARSHDGLEITSISCTHPEQILEKITSTCKVVGIDEAHMWLDPQMYSAEQIAEIWNTVFDELESKSVRIYVAGLDKSYRGTFFASHLALSARCIVQGQHSWCRTEKCRKPAMYTSLIHRPETNGDIIVGGRDLYQPACRKHFYANLESVAPL